MSVDLPDPDGPMTATYSPGAMAKLTPRSASTFTSPRSYVFVTFATSIACRVLFMPESLDRVERGGAPRRIGAERERDDGGEDGRDQDAANPRDRRHDAGDVDDRELVDEAADRDPEEQTHQTAEPREHERLDEELQQYLQPRRADRLAQPDLARALGNADQHDVQDADPRDEQRDCTDHADDHGDSGEDAVDPLGERLAVARLVFDASAFDVPQPRERVRFRALHL